MTKIKSYTHLYIIEKLIPTVHLVLIVNKVVEEIEMSELEIQFYHHDAA